MLAPYYGRVADRIDDVAGLVTRAQWSVREIHTWGYQADDFDTPDCFIFDLDPGPDMPWSQVVQGAKGVRFLLERHDLECWVKTSGGKANLCAYGQRPGLAPTGNYGCSPRAA